MNTYVDANLKLTNSVDERKAIVVYVDGRIEVTFIEPVAHFKNLEEAWVAKGRWVRTHNRYQQHQNRFSLPSAESLLSANAAEDKLLFHSCHTSSSSDDWHGRTDFWYMLDAKGKKMPDYGEVLENVYVALRLTPAEFSVINPAVNFETLKQNCL